MPAPIFRLTLEEFRDLAFRYPFRRRIDVVHMHHTWRPRHGDFRGEPTILAMRDYHMRHNGWSDIAQHVTVDPEGGIWTGRDWNLRPASATGYNGNATVGPFMMEIIGDFDKNRDPFDGKQREASLNVIAAIQRRFALAPQALRFHNQMSQKTCPGNTIDREEVISAVAALHQDLRDRSAPAGGDWANPLGYAATERPDLVIRAALDASGDRSRAARPLDPDEESAEETMSQEQQSMILGDWESARVLAGEGRDDRAGEEAPFTPAMLDALAPHLINLRQGRLSSGGRIETTREDVDAIFEGLAGWLSREGRDSRRVVLYAHGGLVSEDSGLRIAWKHVDWWKTNGVYPIYFLWETGFCETLGQMLSAAAFRGDPGAAARGLSDLSDRLIERTARALRGPAVWGTMKRSAERAFDQEVDLGGDETNARYVLHKLLDLCEREQGKLELHLVGHSAGSIFHTHLLDAYWRMRARRPKQAQSSIPSFRSGHFMAPAVSADLFLRKLDPLVGKGKGLDHLTMFTMRQHQELDDHCGKLYRKSLLYLIYHALEDAEETDVLGLEVSLRRRAELRGLLNLGGGNPDPRGAVVLSPSAEGSQEGRAATRALHHGDFDDDGWTMTSVVCRVLDQDPAGIRRYPDPSPGARGVAGDCLQDLLTWRLAPAAGEATGFAAAAAPTWSAWSSGPTSPLPATEETGRTGRRRALCVGIDGYRRRPLAGCVNDARAWAEVLTRSLGFEPPQMLLNDNATRSSILRGLQELITTSRPGDVAVFQYAGHGTTVPDQDGDETAGPYGPTDQAICPVDCDQGALLVDDDLRELFTQIPPGVNLTCFLDCCHSGTITRFAVGLAPQLRGRAAEVSARFLPATPEMVRAHRSFRATNPSAARGTRAGLAGGEDQMRNVVFAACQDTEQALEENGHGAFTIRAAALIQQGVDGVTNEDFQTRVTAAFGTGPAQHTHLDCAPGARRLGLLQPLDGRGASLGRGGNGRRAGGASVGELLEELGQALQAARP